MQQHTVVGKALSRNDAAVKSTGEAVFAFDVALPGMLWGAVLRSHHAHARILHVDTSRAEALTGVKAVVTGRDVGAVRFGCIDTPRYPADQTPLAMDKARYLSEEVAAVAAVDKDTAEEALSLIRVDYEELPAVFDPEEALTEGAPRVHDKIVPDTTTAWEDFGVARKARVYDAVHNIANRARIEYGDIDQGFREADHVRRERFVIPSNAHVAMEPRGAVASFDASGKLNVWTTHMGYEHPRYWLAKTLGMPLEKVRILKTYVGGAFGDTCFMYPFQFLAAFLSRRTGRPVKMTLSREEVSTVTRLSHRMIVDAEMGVAKDGRITAYRTEVIHDVGAYRGSSPTTMYLFHAFHDPIYRTPHLKHEATAVYTNKHPTGSKRGNGIEHASFVCESLMDLIAEDMGMDPVDLRLRNFRKQGDVLENGDVLNSYGLPQCLEQAAAAIRWKEKTVRKRHGLGVGTSAMFSGAHNHPFGSAAVIRLNPNGTVTLHTGGTEFGQGHDTAMGQIAAEALGLILEEVVVISGDSETCPYDIGNWLSAGVFTSGEAVRRAAVDVREQLLSLAAQAWGVTADGLDVAGGAVFVQTRPDMRLSFSELSKYGIQMCGGDPVIGKGFVRSVPDVAFWGGTFQGTAALSRGSGRFTDAYGLSAAVAEVEVDEETGKVRVLEIVVADDSGLHINPLSVEGQLESQAAMGLGDALYEEIINVQGRVMNATLGDYKIPGVLDMPRVTCIGVQTHEPKGPFGAKEVGEGPRAAVFSAVANAVCNAVGVRIFDPPLTPEKIVRAVRERRASGTVSDSP